MAIDLDKATILNRALVRLSSAPLTSLTDDSKRTAIALAVWADRVPTCLSLHDFVFAQRTVPLSRLADDPVNGWAHGFNMPGDRIGYPNAVLSNARDPDHPLRHFALEENTLFTDHSPIWARFTFEVPPLAWSPLFREAVVVGLAAGMAEPITGNTTLGKNLWVEAFGNIASDMRGGLMGKAIQNDSRTAPARNAAIGASDPLTAAHYGAWHGDH